MATSAIQYHRRVMAVVHQKDSEVRPGAAVPARPSGARPRCRARARASPSDIAARSAADARARFPLPPARQIAYLMSQLYDLKDVLHRQSRGRRSYYHHHYHHHNAN